MSESLTALWERQPGEGSKAFAAFVVFRDQGPVRTLAETGRRVHGDDTGRRDGATGCIRGWAAKFRWQERAAAYDKEQDRLKLVSQAEAIKEMVDRHAKVAVALQTKAVQALQALNPAALSPRHLLSYVVEAAKLERLSRGEPETVTAQTVEVKGDVTDADRAAAVAALVARLGEECARRDPSAERDGA